MFSDGLWGSWPTAWEALLRCLPSAPIGITVHCLPTYVPAKLPDQHHDSCLRMPLLSGLWMPGEDAQVTAPACIMGCFSLLSILPSDVMYSNGHSYTNQEYVSWIFPLVTPVFSGGQLWEMLSLAYLNNYIPPFLCLTLDVCVCVCRYVCIHVVWWVCVYVHILPSVLYFHEVSFVYLSILSPPLSVVPKSACSIKVFSSPI